MSDDQQSRFPRLSISDLLVLTLCVGFTLACIAPGIRDLIYRSENKPSGTPWAVIATVVIDYAAIGIGLFGLIVLTRERIRGSALSFSPGHWMLIATAPMAVLSLFLNAIAPLAHTYWRVFQVSRYLLCVLVILPSLYWTAKAVRVSAVHWRICASLMLVWLCIEVVFFVAQVGNSLGRLWALRWVLHLISISATAYLLVCVAAFFAVAVDMFKGVRRDWLHYCGLLPVALSAGTTAVNLGWTAGQWWRDLFLHLLP